MSAPNDARGLDTEELCHLGSVLAEKGRLDDALAYLQAAVQQTPQSTQANYRLGVLHAQLGQNQRAAEYLWRTYETDSRQVIAAFHAGWLRMSLNQYTQAQQCWAPLFELVENHPLQLMARGLQALMRNELDDCRRYLTLGIQANRRFEALNEDMRQVLAQLDKPEPSSARLT